jgi:heme/copper-type cytochrome/quinol oxidase subunit 2
LNWDGVDPEDLPQSLIPASNSEETAFGSIQTTTIAMMVILSMVMDVTAAAMWNWAMSEMEAPQLFLIHDFPPEEMELTTIDIQITAMTAILAPMTVETAAEGSKMGGNEPTHLEESAFA